MPTERILPHPQIVDNPRYTREQARNGGIVSGASRRFKASNRHAEMRRLHSLGLYSLTEIASRLGCHVSTVSRVLRGIIRTCLTAAETAAHAIAYPLETAPTKAPLRELTPYSGSKSKSARPKPKKKAWNFYTGKWADYFRRKFGQARPEREKTIAEQKQWHGWIEAMCPGQCCPVCGIALPRTEGDL